MARVTWTQDALEDLKNVTDYISEESPKVAPEFSRKLRAAVRRLSEFPESGRVTPDLDSDRIREVVFRDYRILYEVIDGHAWILGVVHGSRDLRTIARRLRWR